LREELIADIRKHRTKLREKPTRQDLGNPEGLASGT